MAGVELGPTVGDHIVDRRGGLVLRAGQIASREQPLRPATGLGQGQWISRADDGRTANPVHATLGDNPVTDRDEDPAH